MTEFPYMMDALGYEFKHSHNTFEVIQEWYEETESTYNNPSGIIQHENILGEFNTIEEAKAVFDQCVNGVVGRDHAICTVPHSAYFKNGTKWEGTKEEIANEYYAKFPRCSEKVS